ncbi:hypothetical protein NEOLEDRAFT_1181015 [Neolentinus lepideus HHB14362 ss-1]|uniref:Cytochrome b-c1 complex subunit 8 n=1 Tax=Neolentinus lepideus HHB14362 ss-1 TaxID=1314782 RepID=A0A165QDI7_9AGAM|nr:hypothetical protein NEOLEDRAFT_1181015 [Neolentinus lepideus HHB14362 ss-1]
MRPTQIRMSDMPGPKTYNPWWGDKGGIIKQKGIVQYTVSPFRQRAAKHMFQNWIFNGYRRLAEQAPYWIVPFAIGYGTYTWAKRYHDWLDSKEGHLATGGGH